MACQSFEITAKGLPVRLLHNVFHGDTIVFSRLDNAVLFLQQSIYAYADIKSRCIIQADLKMDPNNTFKKNKISVYNPTSVSYSIGYHLSFG